jgi:tRNA pseudouridine38-40 synthase
MQRWKLTLEYDGSHFLGWQSQPNGRGVQDGVEKAIARIDGAFTRVHVAGRTDTGVHATGQVIHCDLNKPWKAWQLREALNAWFLKIGPIACVEAEPANPDFHARFSALGRVYLFKIVDRRANLTFDKGNLWRVGVPLNAQAMHDAAQVLVGTHDFTTFRDGKCQAKSPIKTLDRFDIKRICTPTGSEIHATIEARSFLHRQVRSMIGSVAEVGRGNWTVEQLTNALKAADRKRCGPVAPGDGLYLTKVVY